MASEVITGFLNTFKFVANEDDDGTTMQLHVASGPKNTSSSRRPFVCLPVRPVCVQQQQRTPFTVDQRFCVLPLVFDAAAAVAVSAKDSCLL